MLKFIVDGLYSFIYLFNSIFPLNLHQSRNKQAKQLSRKIIETKIEFIPRTVFALLCQIFHVVLQLDR